MTTVGKAFPDLGVTAIDERGDQFKFNLFKEAVENKKKILLFWYPKDFTFVCPTEIHAFQEKLDEFEKRGVAVVGVSCDTEETHLAWLMTDKDKGGISGVTYPLVADSSKTIASNFGVLAGDWSYDEEGNLGFEGAPVAFRGTFYIDKDGIVRHETINDLPLGRNIDEMLRIVDAWQHVQAHGEVCPANWEEGKTAMSATRDGVAEYLSNN